MLLIGRRVWIAVGMIQRKLMLMFLPYLVHFPMESSPSEVLALADGWSLRYCLCRVSLMLALYNALAVLDLSPISRYYRWIHPVQVSRSKGCCRAWETLFYLPHTRILPRDARCWVRPYQNFVSVLAGCECKLQWSLRRESRLEVFAKRHWMGPRSWFKGEHLLTCCAWKSKWVISQVFRFCSFD